MSKLLVWSPNYAPELTGIPPLVTDAADWLASRGHRVDVVTAVPNYPERRIHPEYRGVLWRSERRGAVDVHRSWLRVRPGETFLDKALYELTFSTFALPQVLRRARGTDALLCVVPTVLAAAYAGLLRRILPRSRLVLWVQDLVLSAAASLTGVGGSARRALAVAGIVEAAAARAADRVVVCSPGFRDYLVERGVDDHRISTIYNWVDTTEIAVRPPSHRLRTRFLYAGNLGYTQGFETLVEAAKRLGESADVEIVGEGNGAAAVRVLAARADNVRVRPPVARVSFPELLAAADVHVVIQRRVSAGANLPSKIASYLASGRPIIASIDAETPAADLLRASGGATLVEPENSSALERAMRDLAADPPLRERLGQAGREYAVRELDRERLLPRLEAAVLG